VTFFFSRIVKKKRKKKKKEKGPGGARGEREDPEGRSKSRPRLIRKKGRRIQDWSRIEEKKKRKKKRKKLRYRCEKWRNRCATTQTDRYFLSLNFPLVVCLLMEISSLAK